MTDRADLMKLIVHALRTSLTWLDDNTARAVADHILREFRAAGLAIKRKRR